MWGNILITFFQSDLYANSAGSDSLVYRALFGYKMTVVFGLIPASFWALKQTFVVNNTKFFSTLYILPLTEIHIVLCFLDRKILSLIRRPFVKITEAGFNFYTERGKR